MTPEQFRDAMLKLANNQQDKEGRHCDMDDLLCAVLEELGYREGVRIFQDTDKWYA